MAPDLPELDCCHYPKTMKHDDLIAPNKALVIEKQKLNTKYYFDKTSQCIKIKKEFPVLTDFKNMTEWECEDIIKQILYPQGNQPCPHCARTNKSGKDSGYYRCKRCHHKYNWRTKTVFMHSKLSVKQILAIMAKLHNFRFSVSSYSIARELGITQKSAYFNLKKIRTALYHYGLFEETQSQLKGAVQYDDKTINKSTSTPYYENGVITDKRVKTVERVTLCCLYDSQQRQFRHLAVGANAPNKGRIIKDWIKSNVAAGAVLFSDATTTLNEFIGYYNIMRVKHWKGEYARRPTAKIIYKDSSMEYQAKVSNNRVEGFWRKFLEQNNTTFQHRASIKNISYYVSEAVKRFAWDGSLRNGLPVALDALITASKFYYVNGLNHLRKKYNPPDYFYAAMLVN